MKRYLAVLACVSLVSVAYTSRAQNLLVNGDLDSSPAFSYYDGVGSTDPDLVPGWTMFGDTPPDVSSWVQVAGSGNIDLNLSGSETNGADPDFFGLSGIRTAAGSRPAVVEGNSYTATVTYDNYFASAGISYFIDWFDGGGSLISSDGGPLADPNGPFGFAPYTQRLLISGTAPGTSVSAGVRFQSSNAGFAGATADNFSLVPEPTSAMLLASTLLTTLSRSRRNHD